MMTFNEFQRELRKRNIDAQNAYLFTLVYERLVETNRVVEEMAKMVVQFADTMAQIVAMNKADQQVVSDIAKKIGAVNRTPGVEVSSTVADDPETM